MHLLIVTSDSYNKYIKFSYNTMIRKLSPAHGDLSHSAQASIRRAHGNNLTVLMNCIQH